MPVYFRNLFRPFKAYGQNGAGGLNYSEHRVETFAKAERKSEAQQEGLFQP
jgi:hypothetical protein